MATELYNPTLDGLAIFGLVLLWENEAAPPRRQVNAYPGVDGYQVVHQGHMGRVINVAGVLSEGPGLSHVENLGLTIQSWEALAMAGALHVVVDQFGYTWTHMQVARFRTSGRVLGTALTGRVVHYAATLSRIR